jgi:hypothetical protein
LLKWAPLTLHDGPASVASAFRLDELASLASAAGAIEIVARRHRPWFPVSVTMPADAPEIQSASTAFNKISISPASKMIEAEQTTDLLATRNIPSTVDELHLQISLGTRNSAAPLLVLQVEPAGLTAPMDKMPCRKPNQTT